MQYRIIKMLLSLLSIMAMTLAYPHTDSTDPTSQIYTLKSKQKENFTENNTSMTKYENCQCMPYYLCDAKNVSEENYFINDRPCKKSGELCCKNPKPIETPIRKVVRGCGYRNPQGVESFPTRNSMSSGETPWVVALKVGNTTVGAGALVHPQVVLTAAHVADKYNDTLIVRAGEWNTQTDKQRFKPQERLVEEKKIHKEFNKGNLFNDIALLHLKAPIDLADHINVICLPDQDENFDQSRECIANGWLREDSGKMTLKKVEADILTSETCNEKLKRTRLGKWFKLHKSFLCAEEKKGYTCEGDGGAPLACLGAEAYKISGLVAWGIGCGDDVPAVYARVAIFRDWIDTTMREWGFGTKEWF